mmetsp:Transcript_11517/g.26713  ORF Transcript_11517/g.26713 Transcript_11517/m.26713 type:complete len:88 (+) Transcript_11517:3477-3740(+)
MLCAWCLSGLASRVDPDPNDGASAMNFARFILVMLVLRLPLLVPPPPGLPVCERDEADALPPCCASEVTLTMELALDATLNLVEPVC